MSHLIGAFQHTANYIFKQKKPIYKYIFWLNMEFMQFPKTLIIMFPCSLLSPGCICHHGECKASQEQNNALATQVLTYDDSLVL